MATPTKVQCTKLLKAYSKFYSEWRSKRGGDSEFASRLPPAMLYTYEYLVKTIPNDGYRRRVLKGACPLYYKCGRCSSTMCSTSSNCGCDEDRLRELTSKRADWKLIERFLVRGKVGRVTVECRHCGTHKTMHLCYLVAGYSCKCQTSTRMKETWREKFGEDFYQTKLDKRGVKVELLSPYLGMNNKIKFRCLVCDEVTEAYAGNVSKGKGCFTCGKQKHKDRCLAEYGVPYTSQRPEVRKKARDTMVARYGVPHALQNKEFFHKMQRSSVKRKEYSLGDTTVYLQGNEPLALDWIRQNTNVSLKDILCGDRADIPSIDYEWEGDWRVYHPDFYIPKKKAIVEVKSVYTYTAGRDRTIQKRIGL